MIDRMRASSNWILSILYILSPIEQENSVVPVVPLWLVSYRLPFAAKPDMR